MSIAPDRRTVGILLMLSLCAIVIAAGRPLEGWLEANVADAGLDGRPALSRCVAAADDPTVDWPRIHNADTRFQATYQCGGLLVTVDVAQFVRQAQGKEAVSASNRIVDTRTVSAARPSVAEIGDLPVRIYEMDRAARPGLRWTWYAVDATPVASGLGAKLLEMGHAAILDRPAVAIFSVTAWAPPSAVTEQTLATVTQEVWAWYLQS